ncbi:MAG: thioesterase family protein [Acidimicrobiia bacterium]|nr:thioesterase family protein [Acidimicrobiia bacterium]
MAREEVEFRSLDGTPLAAHLYIPDSDGPHPAIVLSHGFGAVKEMSLDRYADVFHSAGFACLLYDHRNTGSSGGTQRGEIDPWQQVSDMSDAITYAGSRAEVDDRVTEASLDHATWFHRPAKADQWLYYEQRVECTSGGRGLASGRFYDSDGMLIATCMQEGLMRWNG